MHDFEIRNALDLDFRCWLSQIGGNFDELAEISEKLETARGEDRDWMLGVADEIVNDIMCDLAGAIRRTIEESFNLLPF